MLQRLLLLQNRELKTILMKCGWPSTGTKPVMAEHILSRAPHSWLTVFQNSTKPEGSLAPAMRQPSEHRILSIDMGIKNLALCLLKVTKPDPAIDQPVLPKVLMWRKFSLLNSFESRAGLVAPAPVDEEEGQADRTAEIDFSAASLAPLATSLARELVNSYKPTIIAIEKQRYRSMGAAAVLEWTLRVNSLEAMLHASLRVLQEHGYWATGSTLSICPQRVTAFWLNGHDLPAKSRGGSTTKALKIALVKDWLQNRQFVSLDSNPVVTQTASLFHRATGRSKLVSGTKLDDLADSLLQGLALVSWEENRLRLLRDWAKD